jgi:hypothetical protein
MLKSLLLGLAATALASGTALAADANHPEASFRTMVNQGYQVIATMYVPASEAKQIGMNGATPTTVVTLQKGTSVAVCAFSAQNWVFMADSDLESASGCDYRSYASATAPAAPATPAAPAAPAAPTAPSTPAPSAAPAPVTPAPSAAPAPAPAAPAQTSAPSETSTPPSSTGSTDHGM